MTSKPDVDRQKFLPVADVSRETAKDLDIYAQLLIKWQASINLVGPQTIGQLWTRHFLDSLQMRRVEPDARRYVDMGSGAGFPGLVIALALKGMPRAEVILIESNSKKAAFLREVIRVTAAPAKVINDRVEKALPSLGRVDVVTARALAPLAQLLDWCAPLLKSGTVAVFSKGRDLDKEVADAARCWAFDYDVLPSVVESDSAIIRIRTLAPRQGASAS